jgi:hypothetical protein
MDRGERRRRTRNIALKRHRWWTSVIGGYITEGDVPGHWKKRSPQTCGCSKRTPGRPRVSKGCCYWGWPNKIYRHRRDARELNQVLRGLSFNKADAMITLKGV